MRHILCAGLSVVLALGILHSVYGRESSANRTIPPPPPTDIEGFPESRATLTHLAKHGSSTTSEVRRHAWRLFEGLVFDRDRPLWSDWYTQCDLNINRDTCIKQKFAQQATSDAGEAAKLRLLANLTFPGQLAHTIDTARLTQDDPDQHFAEFANVLYNREAGDYIRTNLTAADPSATHPVAQKLEHLLRNALGQHHSPHAQPQIPPFPKEAIAIKTTWAILQTPSIGGTVVDKVGIWDPANPTYGPGARDSLLTVDQWFQTADISIETRPDAVCEPKDYAPGVPVPISCFFYEPITPDEFDAANRGTQLQTPAPGGNPPYFLILLGFHVTTKETVDWTWQTYYWSRRAFGTDKSVAINDVDKRAGNPADRYPREMRWTHYVMETTLSDKPVPALKGRSEVVFNPYLEGALGIAPGTPGHGMVSNCLSCHRKAVYHSKAENSCDHPDGYFLSMYPVGKEPPRPRNYFTCGLQTDLLWTLADTNRGEPDARQKPSKNQPFDQAASAPHEPHVPVAPVTRKPFNILEWIAAHPAPATHTP